MKTYIVADIGINHNGDINDAIILMSEAKRIGVDCVKFQKRTPELCVPDHQWDQIRQTPWGDMRYIDYKKRIELSQDDYIFIDRYARSIGINWTASVWDELSVAFMERFDVPFLKIPSSQITNIGLLESAKETGKPIFMGIGMSTESQAHDAASRLGESLLGILHCNSSYPAKEDELDLSYIPVLKSKYPNIRIGYSGHEKGVLPSLVAVAVGAQIIERHITLDNDAWGTDQSSSLDIQNFARLVEDIRRTEKILGEPHLKIYPEEFRMSQKLRG